LVCIGGWLRSCASHFVSYHAGLRSSFAGAGLGFRNGRARLPVALPLLPGRAVRGSHGVSRRRFACGTQALASPAVVALPGQRYGFCQRRRSVLPSNTSSKRTRDKPRAA